MFLWSEVQWDRVINNTYVAPGRSRMRGGLYLCDDDAQLAGVLAKARAHLDPGTAGG